MRVLVIEDDPVASRIAQVVIEKSGLSCNIVSNGENALSQCREITFDLILVDVGLPDTDGFTLAAKIRKLDGNSNTPIYALSAHIRDLSEDEEKEQATDGFICKPLNFEKLKDILSQAELLESSSI